MPPLSNHQLIARDDSGDQLPDFVSNFQDLSALLSLLAADTVEQKLSSPHSHLWERMSTSWCLFGLIGALRAHLKIFVGLENAERAGVQLLGAGGFTRRYTQGARSRCRAGIEKHRDEWQDTHSFPLGFVVASSTTPWKKPHVVVIGYSRCPLREGKYAGALEVLMPLLWAITVAVITTAPTLILLDAPFKRISRLETVTVALIMAVSVFSGCVTPMLTEYLNPHGAIKLAAGVRDLHGQLDRPIAVRKSDTIIAGLTRSFILWGPEHFKDERLTRSATAGAVQPQFGDGVWKWLCYRMRRLVGRNVSEEQRLGSADLLIVRAMAGISSAVILAAYISTYLLLSQNSSANRSKRKYAWIGTQAGILAFRFFLWSYRPKILPERRTTLLYMVSGSVFKPLATPKENDEDNAPQLLPIRKDGKYSPNNEGRSTELSNSQGQRGDGHPIFVPSDAQRGESTVPEIGIHLIRSTHEPRRHLEAPALRMNNPVSTEEYLSVELINYAAAVAASKRLNENIKAYIDDLSPSRLRVLSGKVHLDLLSGAQTYDVSNQFANADEAGRHRAVRLAWDFIEELYTAQGIVLRSTPWSFGRVHLGVVFLANDNDNDLGFLGFTTMFQAPNSIAQADMGDRIDERARSASTAVTPAAEATLEPLHSIRAPSPAYPPSRLSGGPNTVGNNEPVNSSGAKSKMTSSAKFILVDEHYAVTDGDTTVRPYVASTNFDNTSGSGRQMGFKASVRTAWLERKSNGPESVEFHAQYQKRSGSGFGRISKVMPDLDKGLKFALHTLDREQKKQHTNCTTRCIIEGFEKDESDGEEEEDDDEDDSGTLEGRKKR